MSTFDARRKCTATLLATILGICWSGASVAADADLKKPGANIPTVGLQSKPSGLQVFPPIIDLRFGTDSQRIGVQVVDADGSTRDITRSVSWKADRGLVVEDDFVRISPSAPSVSGVLRGEWNGEQIQIPFQSGAGDSQRELSFRNDILPVLTKTGCNSGKCHGSASGKDGFRLSLYGFDPAGDYFRLTRELSGRRISLSNPESCLLINKAIGEVPHTGGNPIEVGDANYLKIVKWIADGAKADVADSAVPEGIEVFPKRAVLAQPGTSQQMIVMARYSDGSTRDVTEQAVFISNNDAAATAGVEGSVHAAGPGTAFILARFDQYTSGTDIVVRSGETYPGLDFKANNYIDTLAAARWSDLHILPSDVASDEVFLRRVYLDTIGLLPTPEQRTAFLQDTSPNKRDRLVDELVSSKSFLDLWTMQLAELLQVRRANGLSEKGLSLYDDWLRDQVHSGVPVNELVRQLIPASGSTFENPATSYYQTETTPQLLAENIAQAFLGTRIQCAQCHNHPFDRWTMDDYYGFAAFVSQVGYKQGKDAREITVYDLGEGSLEHPVEGRVVRPKFLGGELAAEEALDGDYRTALA
ncbi:MAG TPA: cell surface protein, partial [Planctomycetaceae bacterium]|nr:cell surface protein [Planctomycetaceae bacterium]